MNKDPNTVPPPVEGGEGLEQMHQVVEEAMAHGRWLDGYPSMGGQRDRLHRVSHLLKLFATAWAQLAPPPGVSVAAKPQAQAFTEEEVFRLRTLAQWLEDRAAAILAGAALYYPPSSQTGREFSAKVHTTWSADVRSALQALGGGE